MRDEWKNTTIAEQRETPDTTIKFNLTLKGENKFADIRRFWRKGDTATYLKKQGFRMTHDAFREFIRSCVKLEQAMRNGQTKENPPPNGA